MSFAESHDEQRERHVTITPIMPHRAYNPRTPMTQFTGDSLTQSPTSTVNELPVVCESPLEIKQEPFPRGLGALTDPRSILKGGYTAEPGGLVRKPIECTFPSQTPRYEQNIAMCV